LISVEQLLIIGLSILSLKSNTGPVKASFPIGRPGLLSQAKLFDDVLISFNIRSSEVVQEPSSLTHQFEKTPSRVVVFLVNFEVVGQIIDPIAQNSYLHFRRARVPVMQFKPVNNFLFGFWIQCHGQSLL
jgi:hypothetical protein